MEYGILLTCSNEYDIVVLFAFYIFNFLCENVQIAIASGAIGTGGQTLSPEPKSLFVAVAKQKSLWMDSFVSVVVCFLWACQQHSLSISEKIKHSPAHSQSNTNQQNYDNQLEFPFFIEQ